MQIIIPAFNEERRLGRTLEALRLWVEEDPRRVGRFQVVVVDNASTDATAQAAREAHSESLPVELIRCAAPGKGAAVAAGVAHSTSSRVAFMDADGATAYDALDDAQAILDAGAHLALGSRAVPGSHTFERHSRIRERGAALYRAMTARVAPGVRDTQCGFKVMDGDAARRIFAATRATGYSFDVEVVGRFQRAGLLVVEFPVTWVDMAGSTFVPWRHGLAAFTELGRIAWRLRNVPVSAVPPVSTPAAVVPATNAAEA